MKPQQFWEVGWLRGLGCYLSACKVTVAMESEHLWKDSLFLQASKQHPAWLSSWKYCHARADQQHVRIGSKRKWVNLNLGSLEAVILNFLKLQKTKKPGSFFLSKSGCIRKTHKTLPKNKHKNKQTTLKNNPQQKNLKNTHQKPH